MTQLRFVGDWNVWLVALSAVGLAALAWMLYRRETRNRSGWVYRLLPILRAAVVALLMFTLAGPVLHHRWIEGQLAKILLCVDGSQSMTVADPAMEPGRKILLAVRLGMLDEQVLPKDILGARQALQRAESIRIPAGAEAPQITEAAAAAVKEVEAAYEQMDKGPWSANLFRVEKKGEILYEYWENTQGANLDSLKNIKGYPDSPSGSATLQSFDGRINWKDNYIARIRGYLYPPASGNYTFWIQSDDGSRLYLSSNEDPAGKQLIATVSNYVPRGQWEQSPEQKSKPIALTAGQRYYIEAIQAEGSGDDFVAVGWQLPDGRMERPIAGQWLASVSKNTQAAANRMQILESFRRELVEEARKIRSLAGQQDISAGWAAWMRAVKGWGEQLDKAFDRWAVQLMQTPAEAVARAMKQLDSMSRLERIEAMLRDGEEPLPQRLARQHQVRLARFGDREMETIFEGGTYTTETDPAWAGGIVPQQASPASNLGLGIQAAIAEAQVAGKTKSGENSRNRLAVVMFTDGRHNFGTSPVNLAKICMGLGIPVYPIAVGGRNDPVDAAILAADAPTLVFHKDRVKGRLAIQDRLPAGKNFTVRITDGTTTLWEKQLNTEGSGRRMIDFDFPIEEYLAKQLADKQRELAYQSYPLSLEAQLAGLEGDTIEANNRLPFFSRAIFQHHRVLIIDGTPRWEYRYLRNLFGRDEKWEVCGVLPDLSPTNSGLRRGKGDELFPDSREDLLGYDLIILGDFPARMLKNEEWEWIRDAVRNRGTGLILIDGMRKHLQEYGSTPLAELIPVQWTDAEGITNPQTLRLTEKGILRLTDYGVETTALALGSGDKSNTQVWESLLPPHWLAAVTPLAGTEVLVEAVLGKGTAPAIAWRRYGTGKVLYMAIDETWRWRYRVADEYHIRYWNQVGNLMMARPFAVRDRFASIDAGELVYAPGQSADLRVQLRNPDGKTVTDVDAKAHILRDGVRIASVPLEANVETGEYRGKTAALPEGSYTVKVEAVGYPDDQMIAEGRFFVRMPAVGEMAQTACDESLLGEIAQASGGRMIREEDSRQLEEILRPLSEGKVVENETALWQSSVWFAAIVLLLTAEWILRKRSGML